MKKHKTAKDISVLIIEENNSDIELITEYLSQSKWVNETIHVVDTVKKAKTILFYKDVDVILIDLKISDSQIISITGPSGVGKTTLLNIIGLLDSFNSGEYFFNDIDVSNLSIKLQNHYRNEYIGFVHQFFHLIPELTVIENVALPKMIMGKNKNESFMEAENLLNTFGLKERKDFKPSLLSGGEQQRVSIA